jgi:hypothetical protein
LAANGCYCYYTSAKIFNKLTGQQLESQDIDLLNSGPAVVFNISFKWCDEIKITLKLVQY